MTIEGGVDLLRPRLLWLSLLALLLVAGAIVAARSRRRALAAFGGPGAALVSRSALLGGIKVGLLALALVAIAAGLAGPRIGVTERAVAQQGVDLVIALDVSQSMATRDVAPDRLHAARDAIASLSQDLGGSRVALVLFAGDAVARYPVTSNIEAVVEALEHSSRGFRPTAGTSLRVGVEAALKAFPDASTPQRRALLLISDGAEGDTALPDAVAIRAGGVRVYTLGVGTTAGGEVPLYDQITGRQTGVIRGPGNQPVISRLEEAGLKRLAEQGGGKYWRYAGGDAPLAELIADLRTLDVSALAEEKVPADRFQWLAALGLALLLLDLLIDDRRPMPVPVVREPRRAFSGARSRA